MKKSIFFIVFLVLFSSCTSKYLDHIEREHANIFSRSGATLSTSGSLSILPDIGVLSSLIESIDNADNRIWIQLYTWTEKDTIDAIIRAKKRSVDVRVVLEGSVYRTPWINDATIKKLESVGIDVVLANTRKYTFTHIKSWIIDQTWCFSTGNWSYTSFTKNREFIFCTDDYSLLSDAEEVFISDSEYKRPKFPSGMDPRIGLSPDNIRVWLYDKLSEAKKRIIVYNQSVSDLGLISLLSKIQQTGVTIEICQAFRENEGEEGGYSTITFSGVNILTSKKPYLHAKVFLIDDSRIILGSANMTQNALDNNREILVDIGENPEIFTRIFSLYDKDCNSP